MRVKYWAVAVLLLVAIGRPASAVAGDFQTLAAGAGAQVEVRRAKVTGVNASRLFVPAPGDSWQPLLQVAMPWSGRYVGFLVKSSEGRLSLLFATLASHQATLVEVRLSVRQLLDGLRRIGLIVSRGVESAGNED